MFTKGGTFIRSPRIKFSTDPGDNPGAGGGSDPAFPANTPVKDMTPEQQVAFHENKARRLEDKLKGFNGLTPEQVTQLQTDLDAANAAGKSAEERAIEEAKEAGRAEVRSVLATERVTVALERATQGRIINPAAAFALDKATFIKGDHADTDAIAAWVTANSTEAEASKPPFPNLFQGDREQVKTTGRAVGEAEAKRRFGTSK